MNKSILNIEEFLYETDENNFLLEDEDVNEMRRTRDPRVVAMEAEKRIKASIEKYGDLMKKYPEKAPLYKAKVELAMAKADVLKAREKVAQLSAR
jgi:hypothetical protein